MDIILEAATIGALFVSILSFWLKDYQTAIYFMLAAIYLEIPFRARTVQWRKRRIKAEKSVEIIKNQSKCHTQKI